MPWLKTVPPPARVPIPAHAIQPVLEAAGRVILGKDRPIRLALSCLLARGHLLIEDLPGMGKTTLAQVLARLLGLDFRRIQFTSDLLPADILGVSIFERASETFRFQPGPLFAQLILADELNRASPKTQSALLEAMEEHQVTVEGETRGLPEPFFVIATQNPAHQAGTFALPESQLDRFLMRIAIGYPDAAAERALLTGEDRRALLEGLRPLADAAALRAWQAEAAEVHAADALIDYVQALLEHSRRSALFETGLSPRAGMDLLAAARAWAFLAGRDALTPQDIQDVLPGIAEHRLRAAAPGDAGSASRQLIEAVPIP